jgi:hypothetical protein
MKKYSSPALMSYGSVETLTKANGVPGSKDILIFNGTPLGTGQSQTGSVDGVNVTITNDGGSIDGSLTINGFKPKKTK